MISKKEKYRWEFLVLFSFFIALTLLVIMSNIANSQEIKNSSNLFTTLVIGNIIPLVITCLLIISELNLYSFRKKSLLTLKENQFIYISRFDIYMSVFECRSLSDIYVEGFNLLNELNRYSIEISKDIKRLRIFFYSSSKIELSKHIEKAKPLLDTIFPNLNVLTSSSLKTDFLDYSFWKFGKYTFIRQGRFLFIPEIESKNSSRVLKNHTHILNYVSQSTKKEKPNSTNSTQFYSFLKHEHTSFFELYGYKCYIRENRFVYDHIDENILLRAMIRYKLTGFNSTSDDDGYINLQRMLIPFNKEKSNFARPNTPIPPTTESNDNPSNVHISLQTSHGYNQICIELCNISQSSDEDAIKIKNCENRVSFCKKLLVNQHLTTLLGELVDGENDKRRDTILTDLLRHVSFHQINCLLAQFVVSSKLDIHDKQVIQLLHTLIQKRIENNSLERESGKNSFPVVNILHQRLEHKTNVA